MQVRSECYSHNVQLSTFSVFANILLCAAAAFELTLAEGNRLEKRLFHATFATVSTIVSLESGMNINLVAQSQLIILKSDFLTG